MTRNTARLRRQRCPGLELLEPRTLLSATFLSAIGLDSASSYGSEVTGIAWAPSGNVVVAGIFAGTIDMDPGPGVHNITAQGSFTYDAFLATYSAAGALLWCKTLSSPGNDLTNGILVDPSGNILLTGSFAGTLNMDLSGGTSNLMSTGGEDAFVAKYDSSGSLLWAKSFGGSGDDAAQHIVADKSGGYIISGIFQNTADLDPGPGVHDATASSVGGCFVSRIDASGNLVWSNTFTAPWSAYLSNIAVDSHGDVLAGGSIQGTCDIAAAGKTKHVGDPSSMLGLVVKFGQTNGAISWVKTWGQNAQGILMADMTLDSQDNIILVGSFGGSGDFNPGPGVKTLTEEQSPDAFTGFVLKLGAQGGFRWAGALTGDSWSDAFGVATDSANNIYVTGEINGTNTFDITGGSGDTMTSRGQDDAFLSKYDQAGHLAWAETMGSTGYDHGMHVTVSPDGTLCMSGYYNDTAHFGPPAGGADLTALGSNDAFFAIFTQTPALPAVTLAATQPDGRHPLSRIVTATLTPPQGVATGWVDFMDGTRLIGSARVDATGHAQLRINGLSVGSHTLTAVYLGDENFDSAASDPVLTSVARR